MCICFLYPYSTIFEAWLQKNTALTHLFFCVCVSSLFMTFELAVATEQIQTKEEKTSSSCGRFDAQQQMAEKIVLEKFYKTLMARHNTHPRTHWHSFITLPGIARLCELEWAKTGEIFVYMDLLLIQPLRLYNMRDTSICTMSYYIMWPLHLSWPGCLWSSVENE